MAKCKRCPTILTPKYRRKHCPNCLEKAKRWTKKRRDRKKSQPTLEGFQICGVCLKQKSQEEFATPKICHQCRNARNKYRQKTRDFKIEYKKTYSCVQCGLDGSEGENWKLMEFDHLERDKKEYLVSNIRSLTTLKYEIVKCQILCCRCHRIKSKRERPDQVYPNKSTATKTSRINQLKIDKGCEKCGYTNSEFPCTLDFDHLDEFRDQKYKRIAQMKTYSWEKIQAEIDKCRVLCANCHRLHTRKQLKYLDKVY